MTDDNATGKVLGHVLLMIVRFVCGAGVGFLIWLWLVSELAGAGWPLLIVCVTVPGLLVVLLGTRILRWAAELLSEW